MATFAGQRQDLASRVTALEQVVQALAEGTIGPENLTPNYLTVNPNGQTGANFTGLINALGLIIPASNVLSTPPEDSQIIWQRSNGTASQSITGTDTGAAGTQTLEMISAADDANSISGFVLQAWDDLATIRSSLQLLQKDRGQIGPANTVGAGTELDVFFEEAGTGFLSGFKIIDAGGASGFIRNNNMNTSVIVSLLSGTIAVSSGTGFTQIVHNLPAAPQIVVAIPNPSGTLITDFALACGAVSGVWAQINAAGFGAGASASGTLGVSGIAIYFQTINT